MNRLGLILAVSFFACSSSSPTVMVNPSVSAVEPSAVFAARTLDVRVAGYATMWTDQTTLSFGDGITVNKVTAGSATGLNVNITVAPNAVLGPRDVTVTDGRVMEVFKGAVTVQSPVVVTLTGTVAQGSIVGVHVDTKDFANLFDGTSTGNGITTPLVFTNMKITAPAGTTVNVTNVTPFAVDATLLIDATAPAAKSDLDLRSGPATAQVRFPAMAAFDIKARTPTDVPANFAVGGMLMNGFDSTLWGFTAASGLSAQELDVTAGGAGSAGALPSLIFLSKTGTFAGGLGSGASVATLSTGADPYYLVYYDSSGTSGYTYMITRATTANLLAVTETEPNETSLTAQTASRHPIGVLSGTLESLADQDWFSIPVGTADIGKVVHVRTMPGDPRTDTVVEVFGQDGVTTLGGPSDDNNFHENWRSTAIPAATTKVFVKISASSMFVASHKSYLAYVKIE